MRKPRAHAASTRVRAASSNAQFIAALANGLEVLEALVDAGSDLSLTTLAKMVRRSKPTTSRLAHTLVKLGYVRQDPESRRFAVGPRVLALSVYFDGIDIKDVAGPSLRALSTRLGEKVNMAVRDGDSLIYIERIKTTQIVNINLHVGSRLPLYNTSMGRVFLAEMSDEELRAYLRRLQTRREARAYTRNRGEHLQALLEDVHERRYAINDEDLATGLRSIACAIRDRSTRVVAAINIAVPSARVSMRQLKNVYAPHVLEAGAEISTALGYQPARTSGRDTAVALRAT